VVLLTPVVAGVRALLTAGTDESVRAEPFEEQLSDVGVFW
jgi:hypothetical protein